MPYKHSHEKYAFFYNTCCAAFVISYSRGIAWPIEFTQLTGAGAV